MLPFCLGLAAGLEEGVSVPVLSLWAVVWKPVETSATSQCLFPTLFKGPGSLKSFRTGSQVSYSCTAGQLLDRTSCSVLRLS